MNAKYLILAAVVTVWAGAAAAAIKYGHPEAIRSVTSETTVPRVVVTARSVESPVARVVVIGHRTDASQVLAAR